MIREVWTFLTLTNEQPNFAVTKKPASFGFEIFMNPCQWRGYLSCASKSDWNVE